MKLSEFFKHDFKNGDFQLFDNFKRCVYFERKSDDFHFWEKFKYNKAGQTIERICSDGFWRKFEYDSDGNEIFQTCSDDGYEDIEINIELFDKSLQGSNPDYVAGSLRKIIIELVRINNTNREICSEAVDTCYDDKYSVVKVKTINAKTFKDGESELLKLLATDYNHNDVIEIVLQDGSKRAYTMDKRIQYDKNKK